MPNTRDPLKDIFQNHQRDTVVPSRFFFDVTPGPDDLPFYTKALRIFAPSEGSVVILPVDAADDADTVTLDFPVGVWVEPVQCRKVISAPVGYVITAYR
jgi:hypothetical protein